MEKVLRWIWLINGIVLLILFLVGGGALLIELISNLNAPRSPEVIVGKELEEAKKQGLILQGLSYDAPVKVVGSKGYILPLRIVTYDNPKKAYDSDGTFRLGTRRKISYAESMYNTINVLFLDENLQFTRQLLSEKAFIHRFRFPSENDAIEDLDTSIQHIAYQIAFMDTDKNGVINEDDLNDLYLSTLDGEDFHRVTSNVDVQNFSFLTENEILITYHQRTPERDEHKREYFCKYLIKEKKLTQLTELHKVLDDLEQTVTK